MGQNSTSSFVTLLYSKHNIFSAASAEQETEQHIHCIQDPSGPYHHVRHKGASRKSTWQKTMQIASQTLARVGQ